MPRDADLLPDWFVGGAGKRRLLAALFNRSSPLWVDGPPWSERELAAAARLSLKNAIPRHLRVLEEAELLRRGADGWEPGPSPLAGPLETYLDALAQLPEKALPPSRGG